MTNNRNPHQSSDNVNVSRDVRELRSRLVADYLTTAREQPTKRTDAPSNRRTEQAELVFSVLDDMKLYGADSLAKEFASRQSDPYQDHKQELFARAERLGARAEPALQRDSATESNSTVALAMMSSVLPVTQVAVIGQATDSYERRNQTHGT